MNSGIEGEIFKMADVDIVNDAKFTA